MRFGNSTHWRDFCHVPILSDINLWQRVGSNSRWIGLDYYSMISMAAMIPSAKGDQNLICIPNRQAEHMFNQMVNYPSPTLNRAFAALADPTRRRILAHLTHSNRYVTDLAAARDVVASRSRSICGCWKRQDSPDAAGVDAFIN
jgi:hypothetical protein